jgi:hypothetical protein
MSEQAGIAGHAGALLAPMPASVHREVVRIWEPPPKKVSLKESLIAGAFLLFYLAAYLTAGFAGVSFIEWAWMRVFG